MVLNTGELGAVLDASSGLMGARCTHLPKVEMVLNVHECSLLLYAFTVSCNRSPQRPSLVPVH